MSKVLTTILVTSLASAKIQDLCRKGSDAECARYGENMCCASVSYTFKKDKQDFHACASKIGIEQTNGQIYDEFGFSGAWFCDGANNLLSGLGAGAMAVALLF